MRLINADRLTEVVEKEFCYPEAFKKMIEAQPTAYDVDKVIEDLEELRDGNYDFDCCPYRDTDIYCDKCHMIRAVDIVRHGGSQV